MCGRYAASKKADVLVEEFEVDRGPAEDLAADWNVAPTKKVYAVLQRTQPESRRELDVARWGLVPSWAKDPSIGSRLVNARLETAAEKPAFRRAFAKRRCILPADGYYEWYVTSQTGPKGKPVKQPFFIHPADGSTLAMAGLYEWWHDPARPREDPDAWLLTTTVLTTTAVDSLSRIHDRMPLVVPRDAWTAWLDPEASPTEVAAALRPASPDLLDAYPVSTAVNSVRNNGAALVDPVEYVDGQESS